jgi:hypothetical protein
VQADQPEHPSRRGREGGIRQVEGGPDRALLVAGDRQDGEPVALAQLDGQLRDRLARIPSQMRGRDPQRQRQVRAQRRQLCRGGRISADPPGPQQASQQGVCLTGGQDPQKPAAAGGSCAGTGPLGAETAGASSAWSLRRIASRAQMAYREALNNPRAEWPTSPTRKRWSAHRQGGFRPA